MPSDLPNDYYLDNFHYLLDFVSTVYLDLLSPEEKCFCKRFRDLKIDARRLYVRLANRKGPYFRCDKIEYSAIADISETINELLRGGLVQSVMPDFEHAVRLCNKQELMVLSELRDSPRSSKKKDLVDKLSKFKNLNPISELKISVIELLGSKELEAVQLLFFGNFHQDMTEFVMHEIVAPFESYDLSPLTMSFSNRNALEMTIELKQFSDRSCEIIEHDACGDTIIKVAAELPTRPREPDIARRYDTVVNRLARQLERLGRSEEALSLYKLSVATPSRERRVRLLNTLRRYKDAIDLCEEIEEQPLNQEEQDFARFFAPRVALRSGLNHALPSIQKKEIPVSTVQVADVLDTAEECGVRYFQQKGADCFYVENALFNGLFGFVFWDIIFSSVAGAFFNPFQRGPADLFTDHFYQIRRSKFDRRLAEVADADQFKYRAFNVFKQKNGIVNNFIDWSFWNEELLRLTLEHIPPMHCQAIFSRMLIDLKNNTKGFPDLIVFYQHGYELVEIKGPGDKLQKNQQRWFQYFAARRIPASLLNFEW